MSFHSSKKESLVNLDSDWIPHDGHGRGFLGNFLMVGCGFVVLNCKEFCRFLINIKLDCVSKFQQKFFILIISLRHLNFYFSYLLMVLFNRDLTKNLFILKKIIKKVIKNQSFLIHLFYLTKFHHKVLARTHLNQKFLFIFKNSMFLIKILSHLLDT